MTGPCLICGATPKRLHSDHCHRHDRQRGAVCPRCNMLVGFIDHGRAPQVTPQVLRDLIAHVARCPDCPPVEAAALTPTGLPPEGRYQLHLQMDGDLKTALQAWARPRGMPLSAAVRFLLSQALKEAQP